MERLQEELCKLPDACESSRRCAQDTFLTVISTPVHGLPPLTGQRSSLDKSVPRPNPSKTPLRRLHPLFQVLDENLSDVSLFAEIRRVQEYAGRRRRRLFSLGRCQLVLSLLTRHCSLSKLCQPTSLWTPTRPTRASSSQWTGSRCTVGIATSRYQTTQSASTGSSVCWPARASTQDAITGR